MVNIEICLSVILYRTVETDLYILVYHTSLQCLTCSPYFWVSIEYLFFNIYLKSLDPIHRRIVWIRRKRVCLQINKTVGFFSNHIHIKLIRKSKTKNMSGVNRKYHHISYLTVSDIHRRTMICLSVVRKIYRHDN